MADDQMMSGTPSGTPSPGNQSKMKMFMERLKTDRKTQAITAIVAVVVVAIVIGIVVVATGGENISEKLGSLGEDAAPELTGVSRLDGTPVEEGMENAWPVAVMIENLASIRPQFGLQDAGVVYETLAEGGITRFLVVYHGAPEQAPKVGPVRSSRPYYLEWVSEYDALYAHMGGSQQALEAISGLGIKDLDGMYVGAQYYERDRAIAAPHNLFTSGEKLSFALRDRELENNDAAYDAWTFAEEADKADRGAGKGVTVDFSAPQYAAAWTYNALRNEYNRDNGGQRHDEGNTNVPLAAKNVAVQVIPPVKVLDNKGRLEMNLTGSGKAYVLNNGNVTEGTWSKATRTDRTKFFDAAGAEVEMAPGLTWVEVVPSDRPVTIDEPSVGTETSN